MISKVDNLLSRFRPAEGASQKKYNVAVVGGGPAGLLLAWKLLDSGSRVTVVEKRAKYELNQASDSRSYNLTADGLGLRAFGRLANLIYCAGTIVDGRAIHSSCGSVWTHPYGHRASDHLVSIPRGDLLALLASSLTGHSQCKLRFNCDIIFADVNEGAITWKDLIKGSEGESKDFDLIVFADGVHGIGQALAKKQPGVHATSETEDTPYFNVTIDKQSVRTGKLALNKIHFFPADESLSIGLPNFDGSISLLIEGRIRRNHKGEEVCPFTQRTPFSFYHPLFAQRAEADAYLQRQHPKIAEFLKNCPDEQFLNRPPGSFIESFLNNWRVGRTGVLVGDAGSCAPPWAGFGMNLACSHAADLAELIADHDTLDSALKHYNIRRQKCSAVVRRIIRDHGAFLNSGIGSQEWRRKQMLQDRREQVLGERSDYQIVAFHERGLESLAGLE